MNKVAPLNKTSWTAWF